MIELIHQRRPVAGRRRRNERRSVFALSLVAFAAALACTAPFWSGNTPTTLLAQTTSPALLSPAELAVSSGQLTNAVADLNRAQLQFIAAGNASAAGGSLAALQTDGGDWYSIVNRDSRAALGGELQAVAARGMAVGRIAAELGRTAAAQQGASEAAGQAAEPYFAVARTAYAGVIQTQVLLQSLEAGEIGVSAAAQAVAAAGAALWFPPDPSLPTENPFFVYLQAGAAPQPQSLPAEAVAALALDPSAPVTLESWLALAPATQELILTVPASAEPVPNPFDPNVVQAFSDPLGAAGSSAALQVAAAQLAVLTGQPLPAAGAETTLAVSLPAAIVVSSPDGAAAGLPAYPGGSATVLAKGGDPDPAAGLFLASLITGEEALGILAPVLQSSLPVTEPAPVVTITLSNVTIVSVTQRPKDGFNTFEADAEIRFDVAWQSSLVAPIFEIECSGGNQREVTTPSGSLAGLQTKALLILYPGQETVFCYASRNGNTLGSASLSILIGDAAGATQRAIQVETDSAALDLTLTADAFGTQNQQQTQAAATQNSLSTQHALETEVGLTQTAEFLATVTEIARQTAEAPPPSLTPTPTATATFTPVLLETLFIPGNQAAIASATVTQPGRLYRVCMSGTVYLINPVKAVSASDIMNINGTRVPVSGCLVIAGNGGPVVVTCSSGTPAEDPGGFQITIEDLGPS